MPPTLIKTKLKSRTARNLGKHFGGSFGSKHKPRGDKSFAVVLSSVAPEQHDKCADIYRGPNQSQDILMHSLASQSTHTVYEGLGDLQCESRLPYAPQIFLTQHFPRVFVKTCSFVLIIPSLTICGLCLVFFFSPKKFSHGFSSHSNLQYPFEIEQGQVFLSISLLITGVLGMLLTYDILPH